MCYNEYMNTIFKNEFGVAEGRRASVYTIDSGRISASFTDYGATLVSLIVSGRDGRFRDVVLGYDDVSGYADGSSFIGATVGRYAGRIGGASFDLNGVKYFLPDNDGGNHLHGCFAKRFFDAEQTDEGIVFSIVSPDGEEGFPGELTLKVYTSVKENSIILKYEATADGDTFFNITNHSYFNLNGGGDASGHILKLFSDIYAETGDGLIPTGRFLNSKETPLDFTEGRPVLNAINAPELSRTRGLDHSFILPEGEGLKTAAELFSPVSGIRLSCRTTQPTIHVYTAGFLDGDAAPSLKNGEKQRRFGGVALETQHLPDSPNKPLFPSTMLKKEETKTETTVFTFDVL